MPGLLLLFFVSMDNSSNPNPERDFHFAAPELIACYDLFSAQMKSAGIDYLVTCVKRTKAKQAKLYAQGRTIPGPIVTNAKPGQSPHNCDVPGALAFDIAIISDGKLLWNGDHKLYKQAGAIGKSCGLEWGGDFRNYDPGHFQVAKWKEKVKT